MLILIAVSTGFVRLVFDALQTSSSPWSLLLMLGILRVFLTVKVLASTSSTTSSRIFLPFHQDSLGRGSPPVLWQTRVAEVPSRMWWVQSKSFWPDSVRIDGGSGGTGNKRWGNHVIAYLVVMVSQTWQISLLSSLIVCLKASF